MKAYGRSQEIKVAAPIAARPVLAESGGVPGLIDSGIGQRWVEALQREQGKPGSGKKPGQAAEAS